MEQLGFGNGFHCIEERVLLDEPACVHTCADTQEAARGLENSETCIALGIWETQCLGVKPLAGEETTAEPMASSCWPTSRHSLVLSSRPTAGTTFIRGT